MLKGELSFLVQRFGHRWITLKGELSFLVQPFPYRWVTLKGELSFLVQIFALYSDHKSLLISYQSMYLGVVLFSL